MPYRVTAKRKRKRRKVAGILLWQKVSGEAMVLLVLPGGGPERRPNQWWSIPKGGVDKGESWKEAARREFREELGPKAKVPRSLESLGHVKSKVRHMRCYMAEGKFKPKKLRSATMKWHGTTIPEIEQAAWFTLKDARKKLQPQQRPFLKRLKKRLAKAEEAGSS